ncbi:MAG: helix-turn-helix domain-containing protein [bacterium]
MEIPQILKQLGFSEREIRVYLALMTNGASSVKRISQETGLGRSQVQDTIKSLGDLGLVGTFQRHKKALFLAESPDKLIEVLEHRERGLVELKRHINEVLPELRSIYLDGTERPAVKYYEGMKGVEIILRDVLSTVSEESVNRLFRVYTTAQLRQFIYQNFPNFTKERVAREIRVRALVAGDDSATRPLYEQRTIFAEHPAPSCTFIYGGKVAFISIDENDQPDGVLVEDQRVASMQKTVFDHVWGQSQQSCRLVMAAAIEEHL